MATQPTSEQKRPLGRPPKSSVTVTKQPLGRKTKREIELERLLADERTVSNLTRDRAEELSKSLKAEERAVDDLTNRVEDFRYLLTLIRRSSVGRIVLRRAIKHVPWGKF
jgi:hypothetical protein